MTDITPEAVAQCMDSLREISAQQLPPDVAPSNAPRLKDASRTPQYVFRYLSRRFDFDIDLAASHENALLPHYFTMETDALAQDWSTYGKCGWCNPPYSKIEPWLAKAVEQAKKGFTTVFLIPGDNGEDRYGQCVHGIASEYWFITGRLAFVIEEGATKGKSGNERGSCIIVYRGHNLGDTRYCHVMRDAMKREIETLESEEAA